MPTFIEADRRLVLRYNQGRTFSFRKVRTNNVTNRNLLDLALALAFIQNERPRKISTVITKQLF